MIRQSLLYRNDKPFLDFEQVTPDTPLASLNLNWRESDLPERLRTKHVHRLHPYLGKFIPQLVEIFLRKFARRRVLDPFAGSGTTLVEANALGLASVGCDISAFNCQLARVKTMRYDLDVLEAELSEVLSKTAAECQHRGSLERSDPSDAFGPVSPYLQAWYAPRALIELLTYRKLLTGYRYAEVMQVILSRAARSARRTTHFDLDFPKAPVHGPYFCYKHRRTCHPPDEALRFLRRYTCDTVRRIREFARIQTAAPVEVICGDARTADFGPVDCVVTSPPYAGLIDYHEQHRYAFELLGLPPVKEREIGCAAHGKSQSAAQAYLEGIEAVFANVRQHLTPGGHVVIVVNDRYGYFDGMAERLGFEPLEVLHRHVNRRTGLRTGEYYEQILIWRGTNA